MTVYSYYFTTHLYLRHIQDIMVGPRATVWITQTPLQRSVISVLPAGGAVIYFTKDVQRGVQRLLPGAVLGHAAVDAPVLQAHLLDGQGCGAAPYRKAVTIPSELRDWLPLDDTRQSHRLTDHGFQDGGRGLDPGLS